MGLLLKKSRKKMFEQKTPHIPLNTLISAMPLGPKLLHYITSLFRINFTDNVIFFALQNWFRNLSSVMQLLALLQSIPCGHRITSHCFKLIDRICNLCLYYRIGFKLMMSQEQNKHINIKKRTEHTPFRTPP